MARIDGILPPDFDEAPLVGMLENRETDFNGLVEALTTKVSSNALEGKLYRNTALAEPKKVVDEKADLPLNHTSGYSIKFNKCRYAGSFCLTPKEREFGKGREQTIMEAIYAGKGRQLDQHMMEILCKPVVFCPTEESGGENVVINGLDFIGPNNEGMTPAKLKKARNFLKGGNGGMIDPIVLAHNDAFENLDAFDEFKNFDCTYGQGSALWGDVSNFPRFKGLKFREVMNNVRPEMDGTDAINQTPVVPISANFDAQGNIDPDYEVHWVPMYDRNTVGHEDWHELCISMKDNLPNKLKMLLNIDFEYGHGLTRLRSKNVVWIGCMVEKNPCIAWKGDPYNTKFPRVVDGVIAA